MDVRIIIWWLRADGKIGAAFEFGNGEREAGGRILTKCLGLEVVESTS